MSLSSFWRGRWTYANPTQRAITGSAIGGGVLAVGLAGALAVSAVSSSAAEPTPDPNLGNTPMVFTTPTQNPVATPTQTPEQIAIAGAQAGFERFVQVDKTDVPLSGYKDVATSQALTQVGKSMKYFADHGWRITSNGTTRSLTPVGKVVTALDLNAKKPVYPSVSFDLCTDNRNFHYVDKTGKDVTDPKTAPFFQQRIVMINLKGIDHPEEWKLAYLAPEGKSCA